MISTQLVIAQRSQPFALQLNNLYTGEAVDIVDLRDKSAEGSVYWKDQWLPAAILLESGHKIDKYDIKYDLQSWNVELKVDNVVKVLPSDMIKEFYVDVPQAYTDTVKRYHFINPKHYFESNLAFKGLYELYETGTYHLLGKDELDVLKPNYVPALDAGNTRSQIVKKHRFYLLHDEKLMEIPKTKKKFIELLGANQDEVKRFIKKHKINIKKEADLKKLIQFLNE